MEEDIGLSAGAARIAGQDRSMWRTLRPSAGQAQQWVSANSQQKRIMCNKKESNQQRRHIIRNNRVLKIAIFLKLAIFLSNLRFKNVLQIAEY